MEPGTVWSGSAKVASVVEGFFEAVECSDLQSRIQTSPKIESGALRPRWDGVWGVVLIWKIQSIRSIHDLASTPVALRWHL